MNLAVLDILLCMAAIYCISFVLLGFDFYAAFLIDLTIFFIIIDMFGLMYLWNIPLNAVGLIPCLALFISYFAHVGRSEVSIYIRNEIIAKKTLFIRILRI